MHNYLLKAQKIDDAGAAMRRGSQQLYQGEDASYKAVRDIQDKVMETMFLLTPYNSIDGRTVSLSVFIG